jgi:hypothetical protein
MRDGDQSSIGTAAQTQMWLKGGGKMGELVRSKDWAKTSLGAIDTWPDELKTTVGVVLNSNFPMQIWWGPDLIQIYNDAYRPITRDKHPTALGAKGAETWREVWDTIGPMTEQVMGSGVATWWEDYQFFITNGDMLEEGYFTFSHSPIYIDNGKTIGGILTTVYETTSKVINDRRLAILYDLAVHSIGNKSEGEIYRNIMNVLSAYEKDLPFALLFKYDPVKKAFHLSGATGLLRYEGPLKDPAKWPLEEAFAVGKEMGVEITPEHFGLPPKNERGAVPNQAVVLPISRPDVELQVAVVIALSPHRRQSPSRDRFASALLDQLATVVSSARTRGLARKSAKNAG